MARRRLAVLIGAPLVLVLAAGGTWYALSSRGESDTPRLIGTEARILVDGTTKRDIMAAGVGGRLRYFAPDRCLVLEGAADGDPPLAKDENVPDITARPSNGKYSWISAVWQYGSTVIKNGDRFGVQLKNGERYMEGDLVSGAGGSWLNSDDPSDDQYYGLPKDCVGASLDQLYLG